MSALVDQWGADMALPPRERILAVARWFVGAPYGLGAKAAAALDGVMGRRLRPVDCSGFVCAVFNTAIPGAKLDETTTSSAAFQSHQSFVTVPTPQSGDIICWNGHVAIVYDPTAKLFIGSQSSRGVSVASWASGYWHERGVVMFRKWRGL